MDSSTPRFFSDINDEKGWVTKDGLPKFLDLVSDVSTVLDDIGEEAGCLCFASIDTISSYFHKGFSAKDTVQSILDNGEYYLE